MTGCRSTVFTLTTWFTYTGDGARVAVGVAGVGVTVYIPDRGGRILVERTATTTTRYLYGRDCLGEVRDGTQLYYLADGPGYVRLATDEDGAVVAAWLFSPDGGVMAGPQGPVSHLVCGGVYDWSTGLLYNGGRYFDPTLGIWLALGPLVVVQGWQERKKKGRRGKKWYVLVALLVVGVGVGGVLVGCGEPQPCPGCPPPSPTPYCTDEAVFDSLAADFQGRVDKFEDYENYLNLGVLDPGVQFAGKAVVTERGLQYSAGQIQFAQIGQMDMYRQFFDGFEQRRGLGIGEGITWKYDSDAVYHTIGPFDMAGMKTITDYDAPSTPLELAPVDTYKHGELREVVARQRYRMYLMWSSGGSQWTGRKALGIVEWEWGARAWRENPGSIWNVENTYPATPRVFEGYRTCEGPEEIGLGGAQGLLQQFQWEPQQ